VLSWVESAVKQHVVGSRGLREGGEPWLLRFGDGTAAVLRSGYAFDTEVAALRLAEARGISAPRLVAVGDGVMLQSVVAGTSRVPLTPTSARLASLGAAAAELHAVELVPSKDLPLRSRPIERVDFAESRERDGTSSLLREAVDAVARLPMPLSGPVFVHGDLWQGNTMWVADELVAVIDWDAAGAGHPGIDVGSMRCDAAMLFGDGAADVVTTGWQERAGRPPPDLAYWDVVAAVNTPPDLAEWESVIQDQGRPDLDAATLNTRRDSFLRAALDRLAGA
jgi:aminoglycoside phosphotransferase (APT) family kinase protein